MDVLFVDNSRRWIGLKWVLAQHWWVPVGKLSCLDGFLVKRTGESLECMVSEWCNLWGMKLNASKTKTMIVSRSHTTSSKWRVLNSFEFKMTFEKHILLVSRSASQRLSILRKSWRVFHDRTLLERCFRGFVLPVLEYCSAVWCSAANTYLKLLDRAVSGARFLTGSVFYIAHHRYVAVLCMLYKIMCNPMHLLNDDLPGPYVPVRVTRGALVAHRYTYALPRCRTSQYRRIFSPFSVILERSCWNDHTGTINYMGLAGFKSRANAFLLA